MLQGGCGRVLGFIILLSIVAFICGYASSGILGDFFATNITERFRMNVGPSAGQNIAERLGITAPPGAMDFYYAEKGSRGTWVRFSIPPSQASGIFRGSRAINCPRGPALFPGFRPVFVADRELSTTEMAQISAWWQPQNAGGFSALECTGQQGQVVRMMVDTTNPNLWTYYVEIVQPYG